MRTLLALVTVLGLGLAAGCSSSDTPAKDRTMTPSVSSLSLESAKARAQQAAQDSAKLLGPGATLEEFDPGGGVSYCADRSDPPKGTPVNWDSTYSVRGIAKDTALLDSWPKAMEERGWKRLYGDRASGDVAVGDEEGFTLVLGVNEEKVALSVETPCVRPSDPDHPLANPPGRP